MSYEDAETFEINDCKVKHETDKALLVESEELGEPMWIPKSVIHDNSEVWQKGDEGTLTVQFWWAEQEGLC